MMVDVEAKIVRCNTSAALSCLIPRKLLGSGAPPSHMGSQIERVVTVRHGHIPVSMLQQSMFDAWVSTRSRSHASTGRRQRCIIILSVMLLGYATSSRVFDSLGNSCSFTKQMAAMRCSQRDGHWTRRSCNRAIACIEMRNVPIATAKLKQVLRGCGPRADPSAASVRISAAVGKAPDHRADGLNFDCIFAQYTRRPEGPDTSVERCCDCRKDKGDFAAGACELHAIRAGP